MTVHDLSLIRIALLTSVALFASGCGSSKAPAPKGSSKPVAAKIDHDSKDESKDSAHSGWWCAEHGVPEGVCSQCSAKFAAECKKKGDWCAEHERAESQCFICHPKAKEKFAAQYRAKYGKEPPAIEEEKDADAEKKS